MDRAVPSAPLDATFTNQDGQQATLSNFAGKPVFLFRAPVLTSCQEERPVTNGALLAFEREFTRSTSSPRLPLSRFAVDPRRDTPRMDAYATLNGVSWPLLTAPPPRVSALWHCFGIYSQAVPEGSPPRHRLAVRPALHPDVDHSDGFILLEHTYTSASSRPGWSAERRCPSHFGTFSGPKASTTSSTPEVEAGRSLKPWTPFRGRCINQVRKARPSLFHQHGHRGKLGTPDQSEATMDRFRPYRDQIAFVAALVLPLGVAALLVPFRGDFANTASALILVAVIVAVAALGNRFSGFVATVECHLVVRRTSSPSPTRGSPSHTVPTSRRRSAFSWSGSSSPSSLRAIGTTVPARPKRPTTSA